MTNTLPILKYPNPKLHEISTPVTKFGSELESFGKDLFVTMKANGGVGLAAPQVGILKRIIAVWVEEEHPMVFFNPEIVSSSEDMFPFREGCLSVPGYFEGRERARNITLKFQDYLGTQHEAEFKDVYAFCIQHEIDHLNGRVFIDNLSELKKDRIKTKIKKLNR